MITEKEMNIQSLANSSSAEKLCYLAGGMTGYKYEECIKWRRDAMDLFLPHIKGVSPLRDYENLRGKKLKKYMPGNIMHSANAIFKRDFNDVKRSDAILVNFLGSKIVSIGTVIEIGWATAWNKPIVIIVDKKNIHNHPLVNEAGVLVVDNLRDGVYMINSILRSGD